MKIPYGYYLNDKNEVSIDSTKADAVIMIYDNRQNRPKHDF